jgi:DNA mismatch repair ATPase MutS
MNLEELTAVVRENALIKERIDELTAIQNDLKKQIKEAVVAIGEENDRGHVFIDINDEVTGIKTVMHQRKVSKVLDIDVAEELLKEKGMHERCIKMVPVLNEEEIMAAYYAEELTEEDIDKMFPAKISWALVMPKG